MVEPGKFLRVGPLEEGGDGAWRYPPRCDGALYIRADLVKPVLEIAQRNEASMAGLVLDATIEEGEER